MRKIIILFLLTFLQVSFVQASATSTLDKAQQGIGTIQEILGTTEGTFKKVGSIWDSINERLILAWNNKYFGKYLVMVKENIKEGIAQERGELKESFETEIPKAWEYLKEKIF